MTASAAWSDLKSRNVGDCVDLYLSRAQEIPLYGCRLFKAQEKLPTDSEECKDIWIAVEESQIRILDSEMIERNSYAYPSVVTFGGYKEDFMIVAQCAGKDPDKTTRHLFSMPSGKVLEVTLLIASYINAVVARAGISLKSAGNQFAVHGAAMWNEDFRLWDMESSG